MAQSDFRAFIPVGTHPRLGDVNFKDYDVRSWVNFGLQVPFVRELLTGWEKLYEEPFLGITANGQIEDVIYPLREENAPVEEMRNAASRVLEEAAKAGASDVLRYPIDADEWRRWMNPEFYFIQCGMRLEDYGPAVTESVISLIRASLSKEGFEKAIGCMRINGFLGDLVGAQHLMNEKSYNVIIFGEPSLTTPWDWSLWGHHLSMCVFVVGTQMVVSPCFFGCEPSCIDEGPHAGLQLFGDEMKLATTLMQTMTPAERQSCIIYDQVEHPDMPAGFPHPADGRNLAGAYEDNRIIPYSGAQVSEFSPAAQEGLLKLVEKFLDFIPEHPRAVKMADIRRLLDRTWFMWMGQYGDNDVFHFRIHSPVIICEFDHECGMYLTNAKPGQFHIHTVVRTPNGNDYGKELLRRWREENGIGKQALTDR